MEMQEGNLTLEVLKWVGLAFAAGIVGYFGRYLAMLIIERVRKRHPQQTITTEPAEDRPASQDSTLEASRLKLEKKKAKAEAKKAKKEQKN
ncbi:hypothetical protein ACFLV3_04675 [Chloroflexota bacterium]